MARRKFMQANNISYPGAIPPGPLLASFLFPFLLWLGVFLSFRIGQRRDLEFHDQIQVLLDQCERVACRLSNLFR